MGIKQILILYCCSYVMSTEQHVVGREEGTILLYYTILYYTVQKCPEVLSFSKATLTSNGGEQFILQTCGKDIV